MREYCPYKPKLIYRCNNIQYKNIIHDFGYRGHEAQEHHLVEIRDLSALGSVRIGNYRVDPGKTKCRAATPNGFRSFDIQRVPGHVTIVSFCGVFGCAFLLLSYTSNINMQYGVHSNHI